MAAKPERRKMPKFEMTDEKRNNLRTISAVSKMLADDPTLAKEIADVFDEVTKAKEKELIDRVSELLSKRVPGIETENAKDIFPIWYIMYFQPEKMEDLQRIIWI
jgi:hypothetical protein